jgi:hypothetical protein
MEFECVCGAVLVDEGVSLPCKGYLISDSDYTDLLTSSLAELKAFFAVDTPEARDRWMSKHFGLQWRRDLTDAQHLEEFVHAQIMDRSRMVYECPECGRLLIDERSDDTINLVEYRPERGHNRLLALPLSRRGQ